MIFLDDDKDAALQQLKFLGEYRSAIFEEFFRNALQAGYVFIHADKTFRPMGKPQFITREFNKGEFSDFLEMQTPLEGQPTLPFQGTQWVYYEVYWQHNRTSWRLKEEVKPTGPAVR